MATAAPAENRTALWADDCITPLVSGSVSSPRTQIAARQPLLYAALAFAAGLYAGKYLWRPSIWWVTAAVVFIFSAIYLLQSRRRAAFILSLGAIFFSGALTIQVNGSGAASSVPAFENTELLVTAHVVAEGELQPQPGDSFRQRVDVETETLESDSRLRQAQFRVRLSIYSNQKQLMPLLQYGQRIRFPATLIAPRNFRNPGAFDYAGYLHEKGISATASLKFGDLELLPGLAGSRMEQLRERIHRSIIGKIHQLWPEQQAGLMDAILIGEDTFIERPVRVDFQRSGTYHVLVVSGMNVSILALFVVWLFRKMGLGQVTASVMAIALILAYAAITNVGPPVWRAALMFAVYLATRLVYRDRAMLNALGAAALLLLIYDPPALLGASFQMTFLCVGLVAGIGLPLLERTIEPYSRALRNLNSFAYDRHLPPTVAQFRLDLRLLNGRLQQILPTWLSIRILIYFFRFAFGFTELVVMSAIMQFGLALPMAYYFHRATSVAMPANLLIIPFLQLLMPAAAIAIMLGYVSLTLAKLPAAIAAFALHGITGTVKWL